MKFLICGCNSIAFDTQRIFDAISKAAIREEEKRVEEAIRSVELFGGVGGLQKAIYEIVSRSIDDSLADSYDNILANSPSHYSAAYFNALFELTYIRERLEKRRQELRTLRRLKTESISMMLRTLWNNRNKVGRSCTSAVSDPMLMTIPTPPTSVAAMCSLERGGAVVAIGC